MPRQIHELTNDELTRMIGNYDARGLTVGGKWPRSDLAIELDRRKTSIYEPVRLARLILAECHKAADKRVSYKDLYQAWHGERHPLGQYWVNQLTDGLGVLGAWCWDHGLPIISVLVVNDGTRELSPKAAINIWTALRDRFSETPDSVDEFARQQGEAALAMPPSNIDVVAKDTV
ncbi:hypothetical protein [Sphingobium bisphenolivorans]|uniref:hypothetical protein n=1 Tax=Sphingobium bisphenolivorans TaxID=1335760 RepID=UPI0003B511EB|nr:hypothetical protein [Sphingobium bisphenolivorans]